VSNGNTQVSSTDVPLRSVSTGLAFKNSKTPTAQCSSNQHENILSTVEHARIGDVRIGSAQSQSSQATQRPETDRRAMPIMNSMDEHDPKALHESQLFLGDFKSRRGMNNNTHRCFSSFDSIIVFVYTCQTFSYSQNCRCQQQRSSNHFQLTANV
jgi:hypothetical protein